MKTTKLTRRALGYLAFGLMFLGCSGSTRAQDNQGQGTNFSASIRAGVSNTDNVFLVADPNETEETIYQLSPSLNLDYANQRIDALLRYQYDWYKYADRDTTNEYHRYDARLNSELVDDALFLDLGASRSLSIVDPDAVIPPGGLPISNNLTNRDEYFINPRLDKTLGRSVTVAANYRYADVRYDDSDLEDPAQVQNNTNESANFKIENYRRGQGLTWAASYEWRETEYDVDLPWEYNKASAELGFWMGGSTRIFASGGKESAWDDPIDRSLQDEFWEAGFAYQSGDSLSAEFAAGERSFGSSWRGQLDWSFRRGTLAFSYAETPTTTGLNSYSGGNLLNEEAPDDYLADPRTSERYISERAQANLNLEFRRTSIGFVIYDETRSGRYRADGTLLGDETQSGVSASLSWQVGIRTSLAAYGSINNRESENAGESDYINTSLTANYRLGSSIDLSLSYRYSEQQPIGDSTGRDYVANTISFFIIYTF